MASHLKPLFNRRLLSDAMMAHIGDIKNEQKELATEWAKSVRSGGLAKQTEKNLQGLFLTRIMDRLLNYRQVVANADDFHMKPEHALKAVKSGKTPDACLGFFNQDTENIRVVVELKAPGTDLDAKQGGNYGKITPVEQAFGYASKLDGCRWVVVSNFTTIRLYRYGSGQGTCHVFELAELTDEIRLEEFLFLLGRETLVGDPNSDSAVDNLSKQTHVKEELITKEFYGFYKSVRQGLFQQLARDIPPPDGTETTDHEVMLLEQAQKIIDRVLFICFCEDTGLLPANVIRQALTTENVGFVEISRWQQMVGLFDAVDKGHPSLKINGYNGGLFAKDSVLDALHVPDEQLDYILMLSDYDFETDLNVNILGHIFEQSISDLEAIRAEIRGETVDRTKSKRKKHGIFYTPEFITRFIVRRTIGAWLDAQFARLHTRHRPTHGRMTKKAERALWNGYLETLKSIKVIDPACGSGAFLVAAFDYLHGEYQRVNRSFAEITGSADQLGLFDLDKQILQDNIFGVDLNPESVEITKLSLWLKTAHRDKPLNNLDANICCGNSLVAPLGEHADETERAAFDALPSDVRPFDWEAAFPEIFESGGFDIVLGNPPYVRQESIRAFKPYFQQRYSSYHGVADLYVYFYEKGLNLLAPGGKLAYIVANKWFRAGYGEPLRRLFSERAVFEEIIDFGHSPIFEDADTFTCIVVYRLKTDADSEQTNQVNVCPVPRDRNQELSLEQFVDEHAYPVPWNRYTAMPWSLEPPEVATLMAKLRSNGVPLNEFVGVKPLYGIKTGFNEAFLIDDTTRLKLISEDPSCENIIKPYLRGKDIKRWSPNWQRLWMIVLKSSGDHGWPWSNCGDSAEQVFAQTHHALYAHMKSYEDRLRNRSDKGRYWWELRSCDYYDKFEGPKIMHSDITWRPQFSFVDEPVYVVNTAYVWPTSDLWVIAVVNSPLMWAYMWRNAQHGKDEALRLIYSFTETLPIANPSAAARKKAEGAVTELAKLVQKETSDQADFLSWLNSEFAIEKPGQKLGAYAQLSDEEFISEVKKRRPRGAPRLTPTELRELRYTHEEYANPSRALRTRIQELERCLSDLVNQAYGLTNADVELLWKTAPPRMPVQ